MKFLRRWDSMSLLTKLPENLTKQLIFKRITAAQSISFPWRDVANNTLRLVQAYSNSLGCPDEYIFFRCSLSPRRLLAQMVPWKSMSVGRSRLSCGSMFVRGKVRKRQLVSMWIAKPVMEIQRELQQKFRASKDNVQDHELPRLMVDHFSFEKLHQVMFHNKNQILGAYDELTQSYNMLDQYQSNSTMDRKTLLALNVGGQWTRDFKNGSCTMEKTCLNITGFI